jgi:preprotein translocase subunit SecG
MGFLIGLLTVVLVLDCILLMGLVLIQLPKKEAGAGLAFGGAATDALFGAGSGNVLTKITKYAATIFFVLAVVLSVMQRVHHSSKTSAFVAGLTNAPSAGKFAVPPTTPSSTPQAAVPGTNAIKPQLENTNIVVPPPATPAASNAPSK